MSKTITGPPGVGIRRCSPVFGPDGAGTVGEVDRHVFWVVDAYEAKDLCLDLTDPTGFMHGVWAVAEKFGGSACMATISHRYGFWEVKTAVGVVRFGSHPGKASEIARHVAPELKDIQHDQPAQALAAIMRHVFEVTP